MYERNLLACHDEFFNSEFSSKLTTRRKLLAAECECCGCWHMLGEHECELLSWVGQSEFHLCYATCFDVILQVQWCQHDINEICGADLTKSCSSSSFCPWVCFHKQNNPFGILCWESCQVRKVKLASGWLVKASWMRATVISSWAGFRFAHQSFRRSQQRFNCAVLLRRVGD